MVLFVLKGGEYALRYLRYKQLSCKIVKMSLVDKELNCPMQRFPRHLKCSHNERGPLDTTCVNDNEQY
jgi:hypothetical protein